MKYNLVQTKFSENILPYHNGYKLDTTNYIRNLKMTGIGDTHVTVTQKTYLNLPNIIKFCWMV
jgi:hypothetical protein